VIAPVALRDGRENGGRMRHGQFPQIRRLPPYVFGEVNAMKAAARAAGHDNRQRIRQAVRNIKTFFGRSAPDRARAVA
jgi:hypothetical protein